MSLDSSQEIHLLTDGQLKTFNRRKNNTFLIPLFIAAALNIAVILAYSRIVDLGYGMPSKFATIVIFSGCMIAFFVTIYVAGRRAEAMALSCPSCGVDLTKFMWHLRATRCCGNCNERVLVGGKARKTKVYDRYVSYRNTRLLRRLPWICPAVGAFVWMESYYVPQLADKVIGGNAILSLYCTVGCVWMYVRTKDRRCLLPMAGLGLLWTSLYCFK